MLLTITSLSLCSTNLWELGLIIENEKPVTYQREIDIDNLDAVNLYQDTNIRALHSNNFIPPIIKEIKNPIFNKIDVTKKYDELASMLSIKDRIISVKKMFLTKKFTGFFSIYKSLKEEDRNKDKSLDIMYVQNLYSSNNYKDAKDFIDSLEPSRLAPDLLLYKIKINIKLNCKKEALNNINEFIEKYNNSDLLKYVIYEKKLLERTNDY